ncbi:hypothetical protein BOH73_13340 [Pseudomonas versuta]|uniref:Uncharacterized protein n=1 Tax=Pseudomonas versuta TaxID=1788301 RepID=A0ABX3E6R8_9PSED|nr:hypothetical protein AOC04_07610 [Pseudomonas versuta]OKA20811.1 hypothetical protein BOH73_13340 [Pseudomonas versuta]
MSGQAAARSAVILVLSRPLQELRFGATEAFDFPTFESLQPQFHRQGKKYHEIKYIFKGLTPAHDGAGNHGPGCAAHLHKQVLIAQVFISQMLIGRVTGQPQIIICFQMRQLPLGCQGPSQGGCACTCGTSNQDVAWWLFDHFV